MPPRIRLFFSILNLVLFLVAAVPLYGELSRRSDIWWTPYALLVPLAGGGWGRLPMSWFDQHGERVIKRLTGQFQALERGALRTRPRALDFGMLGLPSFL